MKKAVILVVSVLLFTVGFSGYASAQGDAGTAEPDPAVVEQYQGEENPPEPAVTDDDMYMFSEEATQEVGSAEEKGLEADQTEEDDAVEADTEEIVTTYSEEDSQLETEKCTLWSCALYKMIVAVVGIGACAFWIFMLVDILKLDVSVFPPDRAYRKWLWFAGVLFFWVVGATVYYFEIFRRQHEYGSDPGKKK